jgi:hypothetical protein
MGVPFYGTTADKVTTSYSNIVANYPTLDPALDEVTLTLSGVTKTVIFNGQNTIANKVSYTQAQLLAGIMSWDLATDVPVANPLSLLRSANSVMNANLGDADITVTPVTLSAFSIKASASAVNISWETLSELNSQQFVVERSVNGTDFSAIGTISAKGNSSKTVYYQFRDVSPVTGLTYYRLKQVDQDGKFEYSEIRAVNFSLNGLDKPTSIMIYPNPATDKVVIDGPNVDVKTVILADILGKELLRKNNPGKSFIFPSSIQPGTYLLQVVYSDATIFRKKLIIQN